MCDALRNERGSALLTVLLLSVVITGLLLILLSGMDMQRRFALRKSERLQATYNCESAIQETLASWHTRAWLPISLFRRKNHLLAFGDTASIACRSWGGYMVLHARAGKPRHQAALSALVGLAPPGELDYALLMNPAYNSLVVTGDTRLRGDVWVGMQGVKKDLMRGRPYTGDQLVYGDIKRSSDDARPQINLPRLEAIFAGFERDMATAGMFSLSDLASKTNPELVRAPAGHSPAVCLTSAEELASRDWQIEGPLVLVCEDTLSLTTPLRLSGQVSLLCRRAVVLGSEPSLDEVLIYSPESIHAQGLAGRSVQLFARGDVTLSGCDFTWPSLALVYSPHSTGKLDITAGSKLEGSAIFVTMNPSPVPTQQRGKLLIGGQSVVSGLVFSDNLCELTGTVNGTLVTDRFHFYYSPTDYFNRIFNGQIDRPALKDFHLPIFIKGSYQLFSIMEYR